MQSCLLISSAVRLDMPTTVNRDFHKLSLVLILRDAAIEYTDTHMPLVRSSNLLLGAKKDM